MLKVLFAASEAAPFIKTYEIADVVGLLPQELSKNGIDVRVIIPKYKGISESFKASMKYKGYTFVKVGWRSQYCGIFEYIKDGVRFYFIDNEYYFNRDTLYGHIDDAERFGFFCEAVLASLKVIDFKPDIIHCNDWQTGYISALMKINNSGDEFYNNIKTVYTIHNLQYQGIFPKSVLGDILGIDHSNFTSDKLEYHGNVNYMKAGIVYSDLLTTVSSTYSDEIKTANYGEGLDGILKARKNQLHGILSGLDYIEYNPETDKHIYAHYNCNKFKKKAYNKRCLQKEVGLPQRGDLPVVAFVSRLAPQKGIDLIECVIEELASMDLQFIILGKGEQKFENLFRHMARKYPDKISANITFSNKLSHRIYAGSDMLLMPSKIEPCVVGQMISLRYGTVPIVRETGGLKDTVKSCNEFTYEGNRFSFSNYNADDMLYTIKRAERYFYNKKIWNMLVKTSMEMDFSWGKSAKKYIDLYNKMVL